MGRIRATDLTSQMDPAKAFDGTVQSARARDFTSFTWRVSYKTAFHTNQNYGYRNLPTKGRTYPETKRAFPHCDQRFPERSAFGDFRAFLVAFPRCDAAAGRPGGHGQFSF